MTNQSKDIDITFKPEDKFPYPDGSYLKVMAIVDGYVMARNKGCMPFVQTVKEFQKRIKENKQDNE
jgi:hypothetical protein